MAQIQPILEMDKLTEYAEKIYNHLGALCGVYVADSVILDRKYLVLLILRNSLAFAVFQQWQKLPQPHHRPSW